MAKTSFTVNDFSGGVNAYQSPRNIEDTELAQCQGFNIEPGIVSVMGDMKVAYTPSSANSSDSITIEDGYGLFAFGHDYDKDGDLLATQYVVLMDNVTFDIYDDDGDAWQASQFNLGTVASNGSFSGSVKPCFFIADGTLRVSPGNFVKKDSAEDMNAEIAAETNYGGYDAVTLAVDGTEYITAGDTVVVGGTAGEGGVECIALNAPNSASGYYFGRNMTGSFPSATGTSTANKIIYVVPDTRWRGVVQRRNFPQAGRRGTFTEWYSTYAHPRPPVKYDAALDAGAVATQYTMPFLVLASAVDVLFDGTKSPLVTVTYLVGTANADATWDGAVINLYCTALYDDIKQESQPNEIKSGLTVPAVQELGLGVMVDYADGAADPVNTYLLNKRVTGARIYYEDTTNDPGVLYQLLEVDFEKGCKKTEAETFTPWVEKVTDEEVLSHAASWDVSTLTGTGGFVFENPPKAFTYEINNGYPSDINTHARYKCAAVAGGRLFAGNVYQSGKAHGDRMIGSPEFKYDLLPEYGDHVMDISPGDGDQITALQGYSDRVLQFKNRTLYIINVSGGLGEEYVESEHANMGVANPSQVCLTEFGVAWVNAGGVFLYDGSEILDMTTEKLQSTDTTDRAKALNITEANVPSIGYLPSKKWLVVHAASNVSTVFDAEAWVHDFRSKTWSYTKEFTADADHKSNMVIAADNELIFAAGTNSSNNPNFFKYGDPTADSSATKLLLLTKAFDLGEPGTQKRLCSVYVTYSAAANTKIEADIIYTHLTGAAVDDLEEVNSGSTFYTEANGFLSTVADDGDGLGSIARIRTVELVPTTPVNNAFTFQLKLHNPDAAYPYGADFNLYNLQFVYRAKGIR